MACSSTGRGKGGDSERRRCTGDSADDVGGSGQRAASSRQRWWAARVVREDAGPTEPTSSSSLKASQVSDHALFVSEGNMEQIDGKEESNGLLKSRELADIYHQKSTPEWTELGDTDSRTLLIRLLDEAAERIMQEHAKILSGSLLSPALKKQSSSLSSTDVGVVGQLMPQNSTMQQEYNSCKQIHGGAKVLGQGISSYDLNLEAMRHRGMSTTASNHLRHVERQHHSSIQHQRAANNWHFSGKPAHGTSPISETSQIPRRNMRIHRRGAKPRDMRSKLPISSANAHSRNESFNYRTSRPKKIKDGRKTPDDEASSSTSSRYNAVKRTSGSRHGTMDRVSQASSRQPKLQSRQHGQVMHAKCSSSSTSGRSTEYESVTESSSMSSTSGHHRTGSDRQPVAASAHDNLTGHRGEFQWRGNPHRPYRMNKPIRWPENSEPEQSRLQSLKKKLAVVFHHHHHHRSPWAYVWSMFHHHRENHRRLQAKTVYCGRALARAPSRRQHGHFRKLLATLVRHVWAVRARRLAMRRVRSRGRAKRMFWWQRLRLRRQCLRQRRLDLAVPPEGPHKQGEGYYWPS